MMKAWIAVCQARPKTVMGVCALMLAVQVGPWWYSSIDSASYLSMARSLARGTGLTNLGSPLLWYSPGYPALISPLFWLGDRPYLAIALVQWVLSVGLMAGVYRWVRQVAPEAAAWVASLTVVNHGLWIHFRRPLSEIAFMCALVWVMNCLHGLGNGSKAFAFAARLVASAALTALLCVIRPVGVMLVPAVAVWALQQAMAGRLSGSRTAIMLLVIATAAGMPVALFVFHERDTAAELSGRSYLDEFHEAAQSPGQSYSRGVQLCISDIGRVCIPGLFKSHGPPGDWTDINMLIHVPFFLLVCHGWWRWIRRHNDLFAWFMPFYVLLIAAHAIDTGARLLLPLLPALLVAVWFAAERIGERRQYLVAGCFSLQLVVAGGFWLGFDLPRARQYDRLWPTVDELAGRIASDPGVVAASRLPGELQLMLEVALDRPVLCKDEGIEMVDWSVTPGNQTRLDGFLPVHSANNLILWRRERTAIASR
jgi:hypothetical protein